MTELGSGFVVLMGMGTVFFGLICIVILCWLMSLILKGSGQTQAVPAQPQSAPVTAAPTAMQPAEKQELAAVISVAVAEQMGTDVSAIRINSIRRL